VDAGGGIASLGVESAPLIYNTEISGNTAAYGAGLYFSLADHAILTNVTVSGNLATTAGGGVYYESLATDDHVEFRNSIIYGNRSVASPVDEVSGAWAAIFRSCIVGGSGGSADWHLNGGIDGGGNFDNDPLFLKNGFDNAGNMVDGNYSFRANSGIAPYNLGDDSFLIIGQLDSIQTFTADSTKNRILLDLSGWSREIGGICDIGAYEYNPNDPDGIYDPNGIIPVAGSADTKLWGYAGRLYIRPAKPVTVWIYTIMGMLYRELDVENETSVLLPTGAYIVRASDGATAKIIR